MVSTVRYRAVAVGLLIAWLALSSVSAVAITEPGENGGPTVDPYAGGIGDNGPTFVGFVGASEQVDPDTVLLGVSLNADGDAAWTVEYRVRLDDTNTTAAFEAYREDIETNTTDYVTQFADRLAPTIRTAENTTGREMALENVSVDVTRRQLPQEYGIVTYRFEWTNFAATEGDELEAGDALAGFFLDEETTMTLSWPSEYRLDSVTPPADATSDDSVTWEGPLNFDADEPRLVVTTAGIVQPTDATTTEGGQSDGALVPGWLLGIAALAIAVVLLAAYWVRERDEKTAGKTGTEDDGIPAELLTDEERVVTLLADRGGRVKQQEIAAAFEWTDAKTSQVVKRLRENDDVEVLRIGRENVVSLPDESDR